MDIIISNNSSKPIYEQITAQIKAKIMRGELKPGEALPSMRALAKALQISVITAQRAYEELQRDGFIETTTGRGSFVSGQSSDFILEEQQKEIEAHLQNAVEIARASKISLEQLCSLLQLFYNEED
jgi:GntR family transcriptional regulator